MTVREFFAKFSECQDKIINLIGNLDIWEAVLGLAALIILWVWFINAESKSRDSDY